VLSFSSRSFFVRSIFLADDDRRSSPLLLYSASAFYSVGVVLRPSVSELLFRCYAFIHRTIFPNNFAPTCTTNFATNDLGLPSHAPLHSFTMTITPTPFRSLLLVLFLGGASVHGFGAARPSFSSVVGVASPSSPGSTRSTTFLQYSEQEATGSPNEKNLLISSPVLKQVYPEILKYVEEYGHPNIPLGSKEGRQCQTLRRLHIQDKLAPEEVEWLDSLGFTWHSLEEVYKYADFDDLFERVLDYEAKHPDTNFQVPKKCKEDPELGAWVTGIRRLGKDGVNPQHERRLDSIGFAWFSTRKCGSKFMEQYRIYLERVEHEPLGQIMSEETTVKWIMAQQEALKRGALSQTRVHYMGSLFGEDWTTVGKDIGL
jgi:hypothetical protein